VNKRAAQKTENGLSARVITTPALMNFSTLKAKFSCSSDFPHEGRFYLQEGCVRNLQFLSSIQAEENVCAFNAE
jgi:hypothetical protein